MVTKILSLQETLFFFLLNDFRYFSSQFPDLSVILNINL